MGCADVSHCVDKYLIFQHTQKNDRLVKNEAYAQHSRDS